MSSCSESILLGAGTLLTPGPLWVSLPATSSSIDFANPWSPGPRGQPRSIQGDSEGRDLLPFPRPSLPFFPRVHRSELASGHRFSDHFREHHGLSVRADFSSWKILSDLFLRGSVPQSHKEQQRPVFYGKLRHPTVFWLLTGGVILSHVRRYRVLTMFSWEPRAALLLLVCFSCR